MKLITKKHLLVLLVALVLTACAKKDATPSIKSSFMGSLTWQTDGLYGYRMLRPADWQAINMGAARGYSSLDFTGNTDYFMLIVANPEISKQAPQQFASMKTAWEQYEKNPTLSGWTKGIERVWKENGVSYTLEVKMSNARIYSVTLSSSQVQLVGFVLDKQGPLVIEMDVFGGLANLENLRNVGFVNEFSDIVTGAGIIPSDPKNINPPFPESIN